jgi:hypothetical protein
VLQRLPEPVAPHETLDAVAVYLRDEVRAAQAHAMDLIRQGRRGYAMYLLTRSVQRQARIIGRHDVETVWAAMAALPRTPGHRVDDAPVVEGRTWPPRPLAVPGVGPVVPGAQLPVRRAGGA